MNASFAIARVSSDAACACAALLMIRHAHKAPSNGADIRLNSSSARRRIAFISILRVFIRSAQIKKAQESTRLLEKGV
jgi:hypothetical protein